MLESAELNICWGFFFLEYFLLPAPDSEPTQKDQTVLSGLKKRPHFYGLSEKTNIKWVRMASFSSVGTSFHLFRSQDISPATGFSVLLPPEPNQHSKGRDKRPHRCPIRACRCLFYLLLQFLSSERAAVGQGCSCGFSAAGVGGAMSPPCRACWPASLRSWPPARRLCFWKAGPLRA